MILRVYFSLTLIALFSTVVFGQLTGIPENWCREGLFTQESKDFRIGYVKPKSGNRAYFYSDDPAKCPASASCRSKSYLVKRDMIITSKTFGGQVCAWFTGAKGGVKVGWLREDDINFPIMFIDGPSKETWNGEWQYASNSISFSSNKHDDYVNVKGNAFWKGSGDNIHIGELDGRFQPEDKILEYSDGKGEHDCRARMELTIINMLLIVSDNGNCGGANVTFSGIYRKVATKAK